MGLDRSFLADTAHATHVRRKLSIRGRVQGVGFRPFVYRVAAEIGVTGYVANNSHGAEIEIEGSQEGLDLFVSRLKEELPPLAGIQELEITDIPPREDEAGFRIAESVGCASQDAEITPDAALCADCRRELFDPHDRRYRYAFINCTNCGPRYSIIRDVPYDRPGTTMASFRMCPACQAEYDDPASRRFHAQPNACPACGPRLWLCDASGGELVGDAIRECVAQLWAGRIVAIKGIGGFHLACRADDDAAVERLRLRKSREAKPLAMMVASIEAARELVRLDAASASALTSIERPIVLAPKLPGARTSEYVAPGSDCFGVMLPYTPLHELLFAEEIGPLVMTSGNPSEEPLCCENAEALERLTKIADVFLLHDRSIERRVDDSVVLAVESPVPHVLPIRRARGFAPAPIPVLVPAREPILAVGGELKSTVCILSGTSAVMSEHLGDLSNAAAYRNFVQTVEQFERLLRIQPKIVACDMHPEYAATRYARRLGHRMIGVQHHHAHVVACMADNELSGPVVGIACDGTGYGTDGAIWGCEVLVADEAGFARAAHLDYFPLLGGDAAAHETWRPAAGLLHQALGPEWQKAAGDAFQDVSEHALKLAEQKLSAKARVPWTSSLGRLFDTVSFLLGICSRNRYEAEAAMGLEDAAGKHTGEIAPLPYRIIPGGSATQPARIDVLPMIRELVNTASSARAAALARAFHETVARMLVDAAAGAATGARLQRVVLSGGCFANRLLLDRVSALLKERGLSVFSHRNVPTGDGGIALGQAVIAAERVRRGSKCA